MKGLPFGKRKYKKPGPRLRTLEGELDKVLIRHARQNPAWALAQALKKHGLEEEDPVAVAERKAIAEAYEKDPAFAEQARQRYLDSLATPRELGEELEEAVNTAVREEFQQNPVLVKQAAQQRIKSLLTPASSSSLVEQIQEAREVVGILDGEKGEEGLRDLVDKGVIKQVLDLALQWSGKGQSSGTVYVVETPEGPKQLTADLYVQYLQQRKALPQPAAEKPAEAPAPSTPSPTAAPAPTTPSPDGVLDMKDWLEYLEQPPEAFISVLQEESEKGNEQAKLVITLLSQFTLEQVLQVLEVQKQQNPETAALIDKLTEHKEWLGKVIALMQQAPS